MPRPQRPRFASPITQRCTACASNETATDSRCRATPSKALSRSRSSSTPRALREGARCELSAFSLSRPTLFAGHARQEVLEEQAFYEGLAAPDADLLEDVGEVSLDGVLGDEEVA